MNKIRFKFNREKIEEYREEFLERIVCKFGAADGSTSFLEIQVAPIVIPGSRSLCGIDSNSIIHIKPPGPRKALKSILGVISFEFPIGSLEEYDKAFLHVLTGYAFVRIYIKTSTRGGKHTATERVLVNALNYWKENKEELLQKAGVV